MSLPASKLTLTESIVKKERRVVFAGLLLLTILSWWYILVGAGTGMSTLAMTTREFPPRIPSMNYSNDWTLSYAMTMLVMWSTSYVLSGVLLTLAGLYQLSSMKAVCLRKCRSSAEFISSHWKMGALGMGLKHGAYCVGCCWGLMALLFVGGAMNLVWIAGLSLIVLAEKLYPAANTVVYISALLLIGSGIVLIVSF